MNRWTLRWANRVATSMVVLLFACNSNREPSPAANGGDGRQPQGGAGGSGGQGGQARAAGGSSIAASGGSDSGGRLTTEGGSGGDTGGKPAQGGQPTAEGDASGGMGGNSGMGGTDSTADAATGGSVQGGQGGGTTRPQVDASDAALGGAGGTSGPRDGNDAADEMAEDARATVPPRRVLLCDEGNRRVLLVDLQTPGSAIWSTLINDPSKHGDGLRDLQLVGGDRVAVSTAKGYVELDVTTGAIRKEFSSLTGVESMRRLPNGNTVIGANADGGVTLQELDSQDQLISGHKVTFTRYVQFRMLRRTPQGTFLIGVGSKLAEVDWDGQTLWEMNIPSGDYVYQGLRLPDQTIAVTSGYGAAILVIDPTTKKVLSTIGGKGQPEAASIVPNFYAGFQILTNGHFVVTNWQGHGGGNGSKGLQLLQYDPSGRMVWSWKQDPKLVSSLHHVLVLDGLDTTKLHDDVNGVLAPATQ